MKPFEPAILTIFGITGDLAKRKLLPALYNLVDADLLPDSFKIVGLSRRNTSPEDIINELKQTLISNNTTVSNDSLDRLQACISIVHMDITSSDDYTKLKSELDSIEDSMGVCLHRLFYLAIPSSLFSAVTERLGDKDLNSGCQHGSTESRLLIEKPFGYDVRSAQELIDKLNQHFDEQHLYRIDHYLAKETVQNILTFRFENPIFNNAWDHNHISHILLSASESIGIEGRRDFYEQTGALRDVVQSHLLQLLALVTMEKPKSRSANAIHDSKTELLRKVSPPKADCIATKTVRGQYASYRHEISSNHSQTETFAALQLSIDDERWRNVPVYLQTGKKLRQKSTEITIVFNHPDSHDKPNFLTIRIQPNESIVLDLRIKKPGFEHESQGVHMDFSYSENVNATHPDAYERVIVDAMRGDKTLFATADEIMASWHVIAPIQTAWENNQSPLLIYDDNSSGPEAAGALLKPYNMQRHSDT